MRSSCPSPAWCPAHSSSGLTGRNLKSLGAGVSESGTCHQPALWLQRRCTPLPVRVPGRSSRLVGEAGSSLCFPSPQELCFPWRPSPHAQPGSAGRACTRARACVSRGVLHSVLFMPKRGPEGRQRCLPGPHDGASLAAALCSAFVTF